MERVYIGIGSNLEKPIEQVYEAVVTMMELASTEWRGVSSLYVSKPQGPQDQPDFVNAVVAIDTELSPRELLEILQAAEQQQGRIRTRHWGERIIDLDILLYGNEVVNESDLKIPHPRMEERPFVMVPLLEVALSLSDLTAQPDVVKDYIATNPQHIEGDSEDSDLSR
ncbi:MAG: 2-amino-4-hydroxy-6-hydroxymethyldihydropteridine diphosphokinase [Coxiellaceae bacterium]|nr:2-amino-4-hydroxy-6-hydroxymethyldihydropteridine diphosphokinase [Coxiellaceae bacterium]